MRKVLKFAILGAVVASLGAALAAENPVVPPGLYFEGKSVEDMFAKPGGARLFDQMIGNNSLLVGALHRTAPGIAELHTQKNDVIYIVGGTATFVTGGKIVGLREEAPEELRGTAIEGGKEVNVKKGDVFVVPKGTPHWFKSVNGSVQYFAVQFK